MLKLKNRFSVFFLILIFFTSQLSFAAPGKISDIKVGQKAPFTGVLMTPDVASKLFLDSKFGPKECEVKIEESTRFQKLQFDRDLKILEQSLKIEKDKFKKIISFKEDRIKFLEKKWAPEPWYESGTFWMSVGIVSGVLITVASGYALGQVR